MGIEYYVNENASMSERRSFECDLNASCCYLLLLWWTEKGHSSSDGFSYPYWCECQCLSTFMVYLYTRIYSVFTVELIMSGILTLLSVLMYLRRKFGYLLDILMLSWFLTHIKGYIQYDTSTHITCIHI